MDYGYILQRAWQITWKHKLLWLFGLMAGLGANAPRIQIKDLPPDLQLQVGSLTAGHNMTTIIVTLIVVGLSLALLFAVLRTMGRAALIDQVNLIENQGQPSVRAGWESGKRYFWRLLGISAILALPTLVLTAAGVVPVFVSVFPYLNDRTALPTAVLTSLLACLAPAICLMVILSIPLAMVNLLGTRACVLEDLGVVASIKRGWKLLRRSPGEIVVLWIVALGIGIALLFIIAIPICLLGMLFLAPVQIVADSPSVTLGSLLIFAFLSWLIGIAVSSVAQTLISAYWTIAYRGLTGLGRTGEEEWPAPDAALA